MVKLVVKRREVTAYVAGPSWGENASFNAFTACGQQVFVLAVLSDGLIKGLN